MAFLLCLGLSTSCLQSDSYLTRLGRERGSWCLRRGQGQLFTFLSSVEVLKNELGLHFFFFFDK